MNSDMNLYQNGKPMSLEEVAIGGGWRPPAFEIGRALEHYRKSKRKPFPDLMKTKFLYYEAEFGEVMTDEGMDIQTASFIEITLCDYYGNELQTYQWNSVLNRMKLI
jgi:hypothetical protein